MTADERREYNKNYRNRDIAQAQEKFRLKFNMILSTDNILILNKELDLLIESYIKTYINNKIINRIELIKKYNKLND